jgi:hypothetical protein
VDLNEAPTNATLARRMGEVPHVSGLAIRLARLSGAGGRLADWLLKVAVERGASHYRRVFDPALPPDCPAITDEEIGIALCLGEHCYNLDRLRAAAQLLSSRRVEAERLRRLAVRERCEPILLHVAQIAARYAPAQQPWSELRNRLRPRPVSRTDALPHWTRLVSHSGTTRQGTARSDWLCRHE